MPDDALKELGENIYVINHPGQADKFVKTTEVILNYIQKTYKNGEDIKKALKAEEDFDFEDVEPSIDEEKIDTTTPKGFKYKLEMESFFRRQEQYQRNKSNAHALIYGQCTQAVKGQLQARKDWETVQECPFELLKALREVTHRYQDSRYAIGIIATSIRSFFNMKQENGETLVMFAKRFKNAKDIMETRFGKLDMTNSLKGTKEFDLADDYEKKRMSTKAYNRLVAYEFLMGCSSDKANELKKELQNDHAKGDDKYPVDLKSAVEMITNYRGNNTRYQKKEYDGQRTKDSTQRENVAFAQVVAGKMERFIVRLSVINVTKRIIILINVQIQQPIKM